jgi:hypothetical protein
MQYGSSDWQKWVLGEEEAIKHIKYASVPFQNFLNSLTICCQLSSYEAGIQTFDTADVGYSLLCFGIRY